MSLNTQPPTMTTGEVADCLHVSRQTIQRWSNSGLLPYYRTLGRQRRYRRSDVLRIQAERFTPCAVPSYDELGG